MKQHLLDDPAEMLSGLAHFRQKKHEVIVFHVMDPHETEFPFDGMTKFVGLEIPDELLAQPDQIRRAYLRAMRQFNTDLDDVCQRNRIERVPVDTSLDMGTVLVDYLNQRSRLNRGR